MQPLFVYFRLSDPAAWDFCQGPALWLRGELPHVALLDLDSHSGSYYAQQVTQAVKAAEKVALWVNSEGAAAPGALAALLEAFIRHEGAKLLLLQGHHPLTERTGRGGAVPFVQASGEEPLQRALLRFFQSTESRGQLARPPA